MISTMTTANFADVINAAGDILGNILQDDNIVALFSEEQDSPVRFVFRAAKVLCGPCRNDVFAVLGAICGKTADEIAKQNILITVGMLRDLYRDVKNAEIPD